MKVRFTLEALAHIAGIRSYLETKSPPVASRIVSRIFAETDRLGEFPQLGHAGVVPGTCEWVVTGLPYIIVHEVDEPSDQLIVLAVFHAGQDQ